MKKGKYIAIEILSVATLLLGIAACTVDDTEVYGGSGEGVFRLSAAGTAYTRAGEDLFTPGTKFQLFAISNNNWGENMLSKELDENFVIGTETDDHAIKYDGNNKFEKNTLDFYGVTTSGKDLLKLNINGSNAPTFTVKYDAGSQSGLQDILWAEKKNQTYNQSGTITLPFKHVLSKLKLKVQKHKSVTSKLAITKIEFCDYSEGTLDVSTGKFTSGSGEVRKDHYYTVFTGNQVLKEESENLMKGTEKVEPTVFPTRGKNDIADMKEHSLGIKITMSNGNSYTYWTNELALDDKNQPIKDHLGNMQYKPYQFQPNYEYDVQLTVTDKALVVTILPRVYDWIPKDEDQQNTEIGNPVTFGGVTWMDRNLGATSADPTASELDWEKSRGFYYQFGRSIPFFVEGSMQDPLHETSTELHVPKCNGDDKKNNAKPLPYVPFIPKYRELTQKKMYTSSDKIAASDIAKLPKDKNLNYNFIFRTEDDKDKDDWPSTSYRDWDWDHTTSAKQWNTKSNQPCPKGWRLPTKDEFLTIYPSQPKYGDITFRFDHKDLDSLEIESSNKIYLYLEPSNISKYTREVYVGIKNKKQTYGTIYGIKNRFTNNAYRLRWRAVNAKGNTEYRVLEISRYPATSTDDLNITPNDKHYYSKYDWEHPTEVLRLPISGYIHADAENATIIWSGIEAIYWTSEATKTGNNTAYSIRMKLGGSDSDKELKTWDLERRGYGCQIRCIRDNSVKD